MQFPKAAPIRNASSVKTTHLTVGKIKSQLAEEARVAPLCESGLESIGDKHF